MDKKEDKKEIKNKKKIKRRKKFKISKVTIYTISIIIVLFIVWQLVIVPMLVGPITVPPIAQIPGVKRGDIDFVNDQLSKRVLKNVPSLVPPKSDIGKKDPFE